MKFKVFKGPNMQVLEDKLNEFFKNILTEELHLATGNMANGEMVIFVGYIEKVVIPKI